KGLRLAAEPDDSLIPSSLSTSSLLVTAGVSWGGGKSTIRQMEPPGGGAVATSVLPASAEPLLSAGACSVTHSSVEYTPLLGRCLTLGAGPSKIATASPSSV